MKRRNFIKSTGCGMMGSTTLINAIANLGAINGAVANNAKALPAGPFDDYKAIVCLLFAGGIDSFHMLVPTGITNSDNGFNEYKAVRSDLAFAANTNLLPLNPAICTPFRNYACNYQSYGIHPQMAEMQTLYNQNKMAFISNVGTLVEPIANKTEFNSGLKKVPLGLYSHSDQIMQWQTSVPQSRDALGVGGRMADLISAQNSNQSVSMNISLGGKNSFQRGANISEYAIKNNINPNNVGFDSLPSWWGSSGLMTDLRNSAINNMVTEKYLNILEQTYAGNTVSAQEAYGTFKTALKKVPTLTTVVPDTTLAKDLAAVARLISVRQELGVKRQIFFVQYGGWDMHDDMVPGMNQKLPVVSKALKSFYDLTVELGIQDKVTTFTMSDFARTITSNGQGSDHAWGGNMMVMGGAVNGGKVYGNFPKMDVSTYNRNINFRGNYIPAVSTDEFYAELALWYGVSPNDLCYALPNIGNFYNYTANQYPVGFMNFANTTINTANHPQNCITY
jgi:uncharacterized protein (DUF1501 family)